MGLPSLAKATPCTPSLRSSETTPSRKKQLEKALLEYCKLDTLAMVEIWKKLKALLKR